MFFPNNSSRFKTPNQSRGSHSSNNYNYPPQQVPHYYGQTNAPQTQSDYYEQINASPRPHLSYAHMSNPQPRYNNSQHPPQRDRTRFNSQRDRNHSNVNSSVNSQEKANANANTIQEDCKAYVCPGCARPFEFSGKNSRYMGKLPLILNCYHTICQECISKGVIDDTIVICPKCKKSSELPNRRLTDNLPEVFSPNFYLLGLLMWTKPQGPKQITLVPTQVTLKHKKLTATEQSIEPAELEGEKCCFISCHKKAVLRCQDCNDVYCTECCTIVHKSAKSLWSHVQTRITNDTFSAELKKCSEHNNMDVEFHCNTCDIGACCYCFIDKHEGHEKQYLSKLDKEDTNEFVIYKEKAEQVLKQLIVSQRKLKDICTSGSSTLEKNICSYFADIHGQLLCIEKKLLKELTNTEETSATENNLTGLSLSLENSIKKWRNILSATENMDVKKLNLRGILQKLKDVEATPCFLLNNGIGISDTQFYPDPLLDNLEDLFKINKCRDTNLKLVSRSELPEDYVKDPSDSQYERDIDSSLSSYLHFTKKENSNLLNKQISQSQASLNKVKNAPQQRKKRIDKKFIGDNEMVEVTHIESLERFYVQLKKHQSAFIKMNEDIENYIKMGASPVESPQINELYLAMYMTKTEKIWCRGRVMEIKNQGTNPLYEVYFIDYGCTQTLDINKLRDIIPNLAQKKPFAIQCELYNPTFASWSKNAHVYMGKIINGKEIFMTVKNITNGVYQVDLMISSTDRGLTSIIDILIHTCTNALSSSSDSLNSVQQKTTSYVPELKIFSNSFEFHKHQTEKVMIANVVDPHHIFIHVEKYVDSLKNMASELKQYYKNKIAEICIPVEGTYVIVEYKDPIRGNWHRALIKKIEFFQRKAHVLLVDWGITVIVPWSNIKMISESFTILESQAILVKLAQVEPYQRETSWSDRATFFLQKNFRTQQVLKMIVHNVEPLEVALFENLGDVNVCINAQLVQEKLADSTGKISQTLHWPEDQQELPGFTDDDGIVASLLKKIDECQDANSEEEQEEAEAYIKQQITVVKIASPDAIYIKFTHLEKQELDLIKELQIHYNKERKTKEVWEEDEGCIVQLPDYYARGKILSRVEEKYKVSLYDEATEMILPKERLYIYSEYFKKFPKFAYKCHLADIRPAGGDKWSLSSIEALEKIFDKYKDIYATKVPGDLGKKSIPMLMWYTHIKMGGALEPTITKFVSINKMLVKLGFAYKEARKSSGDITEESVKEQQSIRFEEGDVSKNVVTTSAIVHDPPNKLNDSAESEEMENDMVKEKSSGTSSLKNTTGNSSDWNEMIEEEEERSGSKQDSPYHTRETEITDWTPAFPIKKREFNAWITCAETEGILYLREEELQPVYKNMETNLKQYFDSQPQIVENPEWQVGQICTISYKDYWYRGKILKINSPTEIVALMIDFGSDHVLSPKQLYREILYPEIPAFASKVKLDKIFSKTSSWISSDYDTLLDIITEFARVVIRGPLDVELPSAEVYSDKGQSINEQLVKLCPNLSRYPIEETEKSDEEIAVIEEEGTLIPENDIENQIDTTSMEFKVEPLPEEAFEKGVMMHIVGVLSYNKVVLKKINDTYKDLISLNVEIQEACPTQPDLKEIEVGMPCICPYAEDGLWYRAKIHNIEGIDCGYVFVFFVDFGNLESVSIDNIKMMKPNWFDLPVSSYIAEVNIELKTENHLEHVLQHMKKLFTKNKLIRFVSTDPLTAELLESNGELCYQSLVTNGLLKLK